MTGAASSASRIAADVRGGRRSAVEITREALARCDRHAELGALLYVARDTALAAASRLDARRAAGEPLGTLAGVPVVVKDALCTIDAPTTCASRILTRDGTPATGWRPPYDAEAVARLRAADAIVLGKANLDEFAMGSSTEHGAFGATHNPADPTRTAGGSSGGSAAAVASGLAPLALGSDTGGSIRQPASFTGVVGIKPTYGRVSRRGLVAFASSLDCVGPLAATVEDAALLLAVVAGHDPLDSTSLDARAGDYVAACGREVAGLRVGVPREYLETGLEPEVEASFREGLAQLGRAGCEIVDVSLPSTRLAVATYYVIAAAEASSNLARLDGVRFGLRVEPPAGGIAALHAATRSRGFGAEVKRRILLGTWVLSAGYYDAYYLRAQRARTLIREDFVRAFASVDAIAAPVSPVPAFRLGERLDDPLSMYLADALTLPPSLAGLPALSVPSRPTRPTGDRPALPVGLQLVAPPLEEERLLALAAAVERAATP
ncbi:MAG: Asp-tRNA(Asn)/Glu-tRNA(Gln) amidotransferase subunit GatA [Polyangiaceae bacterium]|nr:Asp-tRNA(Asn)/Glu-tRNA(Gln) amidotransferase subunit GatA [Polyangiaceae bacterium]